MEAAHPTAPPPSACYAESLDSLSPRSRGGESWDDQPFPAAATAKLRLMCSYGGQIMPRPHDKALCYLGGETRIVAVDRHSTLADLHARLSRSLLAGRSFSLKYQLPSEDLDSLISVSTDEDLDNMVEEYDRISSGAGKSSRLRVFLFPAKSDASPASSASSLLDASSKSDTWFVDALNGAVPSLARNHSSADSAASSVNCLLGLEDPAGGATVPQPEFPRQDSSGRLARQEVQSMPDSPMLETASSFGSASSAPSLSILTPIRVRPEDDRGADQRARIDATGLEEHFAHMKLPPPPQPLDVEGLKHHAHPFPPPPPAALTTTEASGETPTNVFPVENPAKPQQQPPQEQQVPENSHVLDVPIPGEAVSRPVYCQERPPNASDPKQQETFFSNPGYGFPVHVTEQGYLMPQTSLPLPPPMQAVEQQQQQWQQPLQQQAQQQQWQQTLQQQAQQQQNAIPHMATHQHATSTVLPIPSYYNQMLIHPQQQLTQVAAHPYRPQVPLYFLPVQHGSAYNLPVQPKLGDDLATSPMPSTIQPTSAHKQELPTNIYQTSISAAPALSQPPMPTKLIHLDQPRQYVGYHTLHHPTSQSAASTPVAAGYGYDYVDAVHAYQMYYASASSAALPPQYQMMSTGAIAAEPPLALQQPTDPKQTSAS